MKSTKEGFYSFSHLLSALQCWEDMNMYRVSKASIPRVSKLVLNEGDLVLELTL